MEHKCTICGCTETNACVLPVVGACWWIDEQKEICSHCHYGWNDTDEKPNEETEFQFLEKTKEISKTIIDLEEMTDFSIRPLVLRVECSKQPGFELIRIELNATRYRRDTDAVILCKVFPEKTSISVEGKLVVPEPVRNDIQAIVKEIKRIDADAAFAF